LTRSRRAETESTVAGSPTLLSAGRIGRPHGLDGSFYVTRARPRLLAVGALVTVAGRTAEIARRAGTDERPIVRLEGIDDREAALSLRGSELLLASDAAPALGEGEWWEHELQGCDVRDGDRHLGTVTRVVELPSCEALEVRLAHGGQDLLVPMVRDAIRRVDVGERRIEVDAGFLGVAPEPREPEGGDGAGERA
jgi:16S rRNA processing protein RimM